MRIEDGPEGGKTGSLGIDLLPRSILCRPWIGRPAG
jgi:hypothetical protein